MRRNVFATLFLLAIFLGYVIVRQENQRPASEIIVGNEIHQVVLGRVGEAYFNFEVADTGAKRTLGLSGRDPLPATDALLFVFDTYDTHCFWMKDMKFAIDILWFDADKKLVYEKRNVTPDTYPTSFCPDVPVQYVVEVTAGVAEKNQIKLGSVLDVEL